MRQFSLKNNLGETYRLNSSNYFFHDPEGLGFSRRSTFQKIGFNYEMIEDSFEQTPISGQIMFKSTPTESAYKRYLKFSAFLREIPLTLIYQIPGGQFLLDCVPGTVEKTEINSAFGMDVGIELIPLSMWYKETKSEKTADVAGELPDDVELISDSINESPCCLSFSGVVADSSTPLIWSQSVDETEIMTGELSGDDLSISETDIVYIRTDTNPYKIYKVDENDEETDLYSLSDFSTGRFPFLYKGSNVFSISSCSPGSTTTATVSIEGRLLYETV